MKLAPLAAALTLLVAAGCDQPAPTTPAPVEYRPDLAGTVDHALCLLGFAATPLREVITGHQLVDGTLNGQAATFVLDTGANVSVIHAAFAEPFGLTPQRGVTGQAIGLGGGLNATRSSIDGLRVGEVDIRQADIMVADLSQLESVLSRLSETPIHGIIGQDVMTEHRAVIDVARPMLYLQRDDAAPSPVAAEQCQAAAEVEAGA